MNKKKKQSEIILPLKGKTVIVTGASAGIGWETALGLAEAGAAVVVNARRENRLKRLAAKIKDAGGKALVAAGDTGKTSDIEKILEETLAWKDGGKKYDSVVINAGRGLAGGILSSNESEWEKLYETNVFGAARLMRRAGQYMAKRMKGHVVVVGSVVGRNISPFSAFYGSSKFAVMAMAEGLRRELAPAGVKVSTVMPGIVVSEFQKVAGYTQDNFYKNIAHMGKLLKPKAIADGIVYLISQPSHVNVSEIMIRPTGQTYP